MSFTDDEKILAAIGRASFLRMWTWPNLFRDQGKKTEAADGKEICDLTVIFGNTIILFSDKRIVFNTGKSELIAWCRWARKAVSESVKQLEGAERWLRNNPSRVFVDKSCRKLLPIPLPEEQSVEFIRVIVTHGVDEKLKSINDESSFSFTNELTGKENWEEGSAKPFCLGNVSESGFVHIFSDNTIKLILTEFDTAKDFISYLEQRKTLLTLEKPVNVSKESDIVHLYYENYSDAEKDRAILSAPELTTKVVSLKKKSLQSLYKNPSFQAKRAADNVSYFWDGLIESFAYHALNGSTQFKNWDSTLEIEPALRVMAAPGRFERRVLSEAFINFYYKAMPEQRGTRVFYNPTDPSVGFLFLLLPYIAKNGSVESYRTLRNNMLHDYALIFRGMHPELFSLVGVGAKTRDGDTNLSHTFFDEGQDYIFMNCADWSPEEQLASEELRRAYEEKGLLARRTLFQGVAHEFPQ